MASIHSRAVQQAIDSLGGTDQLSGYLGVSVEELARWVRDEAKPPMAILLRIADVILEENPEPEIQTGGDEPSTCSTSDQCPPRSS